MKKKQILSFASIVTLIAIVNFSLAGANNSLVASSQNDGVVEKSPGNGFTVTITFQNTGKTEDSWSVNVAFEGEAWSWVGTPKTLALDTNEKKTLVWNGAVPAYAAINSIARLVVYYDDSFKVLDWWIQVTQRSELTIKNSNVS